MPKNALNVLRAQLMRDLFAIAKFLFPLWCMYLLSVFLKHSYV